jgi:hypothetical protein
MSWTWNYALIYDFWSLYLGMVFAIWSLLSHRLAREEELIAARNKAEELDRENVEIATKLAKKEQELDLRTQEKVRQLCDSEIKVSWLGVDWIHLDHDRDQWQHLVKVVIKHGVPGIAGSSFTT